MTPAKKVAARKAPAKRPVKATAKATKKAPAKRARTKGPNEKAVVEHIDALRRAKPLDTRDEVLAALAVKLAHLLDVGDPVTMTVSWARELRITLSALDGGGPANDDADSADSWVAGLPSPLRDGEVP